MLIATSTEEESLLIHKDLSREFEIACLGEIKHFLGMEVQRDGGCYKLRLKLFIEKLIGSPWNERCEMFEIAYGSGLFETTV